MKTKMVRIPDSNGVLWTCGFTNNGLVPLKLPTRQRPGIVQYRLRENVDRACSYSKLFFSAFNNFSSNWFFFLISNDNTLFLGKLSDFNEIKLFQLMAFHWVVIMRTFFKNRILVVVFPNLLLKLLELYLKWPMLWLICKFLLPKMLMPLRQPSHTCRSQQEYRLFRRVRPLLLQEFLRQKYCLLQMKTQYLDVVQKEVWLLVPPLKLVRLRARLSLLKEKRRKIVSTVASFTVLFTIIMLSLFCQNCEFILQCFWKLRLRNAVRNKLWLEVMMVLPRNPLKPVKRRRKKNQVCLPCFFLWYNIFIVHWPFFFNILYFIYSFCQQNFACLFKFSGLRWIEFVLYFSRFQAYQKGQSAPT